jgi:tetratricopeptide (TPR) repeat protein
MLDEVRSAASAPYRDRAAAAFQEAVELLERGKDEKAAAAAHRAKEMASRSGAVREVLGMALYRSGRYREALRELQAYRRMTGRVDQNHLIADSLRALGEPDKAVGPAREALRARIAPEVRAEAAVVGASALADLTRFDEALAMLKAFPTDPARAREFDLRVWYATGDVLAKAGRKAEAAEQFRRVMRHDPAAYDAAERLAQLG